MAVAMITDSVALEELAVEWEGVRKMRAQMQVLVTTTFVGGGFTAPALASVLYNLPLLLAFDVLRQVLLQLHREGKFASASRNLGPLMDASKNDLPWLDWGSLRQGATKRNQVVRVL